MLIDQFEPSNLTTSSGSASANTPKYSGVQAKYVLVKFTTAGATFDYQLIDNKDREVINEKGLESPYREQMGIPLKGIYTFKIINASKDEAVEVLLSASE